MKKSLSLVLLCLSVMVYGQHFKKSNKLINLIGESSNIPDEDFILNKARLRRNAFENKIGINSEIPSCRKGSQNLKQRLDSIVSTYYKEYYEYDSNNMGVKSSYYWLDEDISTYVKEYEYTTSYSNSGNQIYERYKYFNGSTDFKIISNYNNQNQLTSYIYLDSVDNDWVYSYKIDISRSSGKIIENGYTWNSNKKIWVNVDRWTSNLDLNGSVISELYINNVGKKWINMSLKNNVYLGNQLIKTVVQIWNKKSKKWINLRELNYSYSNEGDLISEKSYNYDISLRKWILTNTSNLNWNPNYTNLDLIYPKEFGFFNDFSIFPNKRLENVVENLNDTTFTFHWSSQTSSLETARILQTNKDKDIDVKVFPNPFSKVISIELYNNDGFGTFELFDVSGNKVFSKEITNKEEINLDHLQNGTYIYKVNIGSITQSGRLIKD